MTTYQGPNRRRPHNAVRRAIREFGDKPASRWHHIWRDFVPLIALLIAAYAVFSVEDKVDRADVRAETAKVEATTAKRLAEQQSEGRKVALGVTCGALRGVEDAGRLVLTQRLPGTSALYPPSTSRERKARRQVAQAYNRVITDRIVQEAGVAGAEVIEPNGSVNCDRLREVAKAPKP
jgi:methionine synthase II (cobalamin-independent)